MQRIVVRSAYDAAAAAVCAIGHVPERALCVTVLATDGQAPPTVTAVVHLEDSREGLAGQVREVAAAVERNFRDRPIIVLAVTFAGDEDTEAGMKALAGVPELAPSLEVQTDLRAVRDLRSGEVTVRDVREHPAVVEAVSEGRCLLAGEDVLSRAYEPAGTEGDWPDPVGTDPDPGAPALQAECLPEAGDPREEIDPAKLRRLILASQDRGTRDRMLCAMTTGTARPHLLLWQRAVTACLPGLASPPLTLAGAAAALSGDGVTARLCFTRALDLEPTYSLAGLLLTVVQGGMHPAGLERMLTEVGSSLGD